MSEDMKGRPVGDAADAVHLTAIKALNMLQELQAGWLWQLLTRKPTTPKPK